MPHSLINPRIIYEFPNCIQVPFFNSPDEIAKGIEKVLKEEFGLVSDSYTYKNVVYEKVSSNGKFVSCVSCDTGTLYHFALDVEEHCNGFDLVPRELFLNNGIMFIWDNLREIDNVKFDFN